MIQLDRDISTNFEAATSREWLETNGIGGFACGTVSGALTRRYHSLLTAATKPPLRRITTVSKFEETLVVDGERFELSANRYPDTIHPRGFELIESFRLDSFPIWRYEVGGIAIEQKIFMAHGSNTTICRWKLADNKAAENRNIQLELRPLLSFVDYHHLQHEDARFDTSFEETAGFVRVKPYGELPDIYLGHNAESVEKTGYWYRNFELAIERERGFDHSEDLFQPFRLNFNLAQPADVIISTEQTAAKNAAKLERTETRRRTKLIETSGATGNFKKQLVLAADQFIVRRGSGHTIIAGYPWFSDWGRDTMISLPGLTLATGRPKIAKDILLEFSKHISEGMLPNRFPDAGEEAEYNTVDATLWYFEAVRAYLEATGDHAFVRKQIYSKLSEIITWHLRGTRYNIHVDTDGLLYAGETGVQLTWMDAKIGDLVITPRTGKPVEIEALWYNALRIMEGLAEQYGDSEDASRFKAMADLAKLSFNALFWNEAENCLYDVIDNGTRDASVRPNQIFAASLKHRMLDDERARAVVDKVEAELLTPVGSRSLSPRDPKYIPYYVGTPFERDSAYHQGTVWPWLIGGFIDAYVGVYPERIERVKEILKGFESHLAEAGTGQISEIFDAEVPHTPRGCFAQAWSVAEILRILSTPS
jgi:predicted glycogen debranching enzyme